MDVHGVGDDGQTGLDVPDRLSLRSLTQPNPS